MPDLVHSYTKLEARVEALLSGYDHYVRPRASASMLAGAQQLTTQCPRLTGRHRFSAIRQLERRSRASRENSLAVGEGARRLDRRAREHLLLGYPIVLYLLQYGYTFASRWVPTSPHRTSSSLSLCLRTRFSCSSFSRCKTRPCSAAMTSFSGSSGP